MLAKHYCSGLSEKTMETVKDNTVRDLLKRIIEKVNGEIVYKDQPLMRLMFRISLKTPGSSLFTHLI